ncbi:MAG TPA: hypothetical protein VFS42_03195 [Burkholderiaceae bacterium]|nr:hypothetical protein [Burkholderiaceae bacterium]
MNDVSLTTRFVLGAMGCALTFAVHAADTSGIKARYESDRAACLAGRTGQDRQTCLREAAAVRDEARRGGNAPSAPPDYEHNVMQRCQAFPEQDRSDCEARMRQEDTTVSGSVEGGGIIRERVTREPVPEALPPSGLR